MKTIFSACWQGVKELLFPSCCAICGLKLIEEELTVCSSCLSTIPRTEHAIIPDNGIDMQFAELIFSQPRVVHYFQGATWAYYNSERGATLRQLIEKGKFGTHPNPHIFYELARVAALEYIDSDLFENIDLIVPVPLHQRRLRERGFNQAEYIANAMGQVLAIPVDTTHLYRVRNNEHQSLAEMKNRMKNVQGLFGVKQPDDWKGKHILLVDDVITSGATMLSCMNPISSIRGTKISVFALGWAHK